MVLTHSVSLLLNKSKSTADVHAIVHARLAHGLTALMLASINGRIECVRLLLLVKGIAVDDIGENGCTALSLAVSKGHVDIVKLLVEHKANVNAAQHGKAGFIWIHIPYSRRP